LKRPSDTSETLSRWLIVLLFEATIVSIFAESTLGLTVCFNALFLLVLDQFGDKRAAHVIDWILALRRRERVLVDPLPVARVVSVDESSRIISPR
jgi:hypothetical protein